MNPQKLLKSLFLALAFAALPALAQQGKVEVRWLCQSAFRIATPGGKIIVTDPWLLKNPLTPGKFKELAALQQERPHHAGTGNQGDHGPRRALLGLRLAQSGHRQG